MKAKFSSADMLRVAQMERQPRASLAGSLYSEDMRRLITMHRDLRTVLSANQPPYTVTDKGLRPDVIGRTAPAQRLLLGLRESSFWREKMNRWEFEMTLEELFARLNRLDNHSDTHAYMACATLNAIIAQMRAEARSPRFLANSFRHKEEMRVRLHAAFEHLHTALKLSDSQHVVFFALGSKAVGLAGNEHMHSLVGARQNWIDTLRTQHGSLVAGGAWKLEIGEPETIYQLMVLAPTSPQEMIHFQEQAANCWRTSRELPHGGIVHELNPARTDGDGPLFRGGSGIAGEGVRERLQRICCYLVEVDSLVSVRKQPGLKTFGTDPLSRSSRSNRIEPWIK